MIQGIYNRTVGAFFSRLATSSPRTTMSTQIQQTVEKAIAENKIVIFSKSYCPFCQKAKTLLNSDFAHLKAQIYVKELDLDDDGPEVQKYLKEKTGQSTVPNIFINKKHVGGSDDLASLKSRDKLAGLVEGTA